MEKVICLEINRVEIKDAEAVLAYREQVGGESDNLTYGVGDLAMGIGEQVAYLKALGQDSQSIMLIGKIGNEIATMGSVVTLKKTRISHRAELGLTVRKKFWHRGIATKMMVALMDFAEKSPQIQIVELSVRADNPHAIHLYKCFGFEIFGNHSCYFKINEEMASAVFMMAKV